MDPNEIFEYVTEGMKWLAIGGGSYIATLASLNGIPRLFSEKIHNQEDLDRITAEEAQRLGLDKPVKAVFHNDWEECAEKNDDGQYEIKIGGFGARRTQVRHELYHLFRHVDRGWKGNLHYLLIDEPQAIAYEVFRLKL